MLSPKSRRVAFTWTKHCVVNYIQCAFNFNNGKFFCRAVSLLLLCKIEKSCYRFYISYLQLKYANSVLWYVSIWFTGCLLFIWDVCLAHLCKQRKDEEGYIAFIFHTSYNSKKSGDADMAFHKSFSVTRRHAMIILVVYRKIEYKIVTFTNLHKCLMKYLIENRATWLNILIRWYLIYVINHMHLSTWSLLNIYSHINVNKRKNKTVLDVPTATEI